MLSHRFTTVTGQEFCFAEYHEADHWLQATWRGVVTTQDSQRGAAEMLRLLRATQAPYLLNDNSQVQGPWFDSVAWLRHIWAPQAEQFGLRYIAHVLQPHTEDDLGLLLRHNPFAGKFELQFFNNLADAAQWLRDCQRASGRAVVPTPATPRTQAPRARG
jgi:hypothetical protein